MLENFTLTIIQEHYSMENIFIFSIKSVATNNRTVRLHAHVKQLKKYTSYVTMPEKRYLVVQNIKNRFFMQIQPFPMLCYNTKGQNLVRCGTAGPSYVILAEHLK